MENHDYKRLKIGTAVLIFIISIIIVYAYWPEPYGNDIPSMEKIISDQDNIQTKVSIYQTEEIHNYKIVGFTDKANEVGVAFFQANEKGNYIFKGLNEQSTRFGIQLSFLKFEGVKTDSVGADVIASNNSRLTQVKRIIRGTEVSTAEITVNPSLTILEIPDSYRDAYNTKFIFYDYNGTIIE